MRLHGLGSSCLSTADLYQLALGAGFPSDVAVTMAAVAMRESRGCPTAHNHTSAEDSYGLWQINIQGNPGLTAALGIQPADLFDPSINAAAAYYLYAGNAANLDTAWYINRPGYQEAYQQYLPDAQAAADASQGAPVGSVMFPSPADSTGDWSPLAIAAGAVVALWALNR